MVEWKIKSTQLVLSVYIVALPKPDRCANNIFRALMLSLLEIFGDTSLLLLCVNSICFSDDYLFFLLLTASGVSYVDKGIGHIAGSNGVLFQRCRELLRL